MAGPRTETLDNAQRRQLLAAARRGDRSAAADLLRSLQDTVYRFSLAQLRDADAAADATQETALRLLRSLDRFEGRGRVSTWALGVTLNVCREARRRARSGVSLDAVDDPPTTAEPPLFHAEDARSIRAAVDALPPRRREAIVLRYFEQLSIEETADVMGCSVGAVKATVWQALRKLRDSLKKEATTP